MLNNDAASTTYSHVALGFDPYYAIPVPKPGLQHEPGDISHDGILLTLYEHIVSDEAGDPAGCNNAIEIKAEIPNQHEKFIVVAEQVRIVERRIVVGRTGDSELNGFVRNLLHHPTVPKHEAEDSCQKHRAGLGFPEIFAVSSTCMNIGKRFLRGVIV